MKECLENLVGLSEIDCDCYEVVEGHKTSPFGLFVDDLEGIDLELIKNAIGCGETLETNFERLYKSAAGFFESDLQVAISKNFKQKYAPFTGRIGERKYDKPINASSVVGIKLDTKTIDGATIIIKKIYLFFNGAGQITLQVYKNDELLDDEYLIDVVEGKTVYDLDVPLNLPIMENGYKNDYYFVYAPGELNPMNNKAKCGCAGVESLRGKFLQVYGVKGTDFNSLTTDSSYAYGLSLEATISCGLDNLLCDQLTDDTFFRRTAMAIWYKLGQLTIEKVFSSREINFDTFSNGEYLYTRKKKFESNYKSILDYLGENSNIEYSNCFVCNTVNHSRMGKILM